MIMMMKRTMLNWICRIVLLVLLAAPSGAFARNSEPEREPIDARLEGYPANVSLESHSTGLTWVLLIVMGAIVFGGLFKDAKRTHLD
jgi:hypothetical protein